MPSAIENPEASGAIDERVHSLSELPQFLSRIAQYRGEFMIYDDRFRGFTFSCIGFANSVREGERETFLLFEQRRGLVREPAQVDRRGREVRMEPAMVDVARIVFTWQRRPSPKASSLSVRPIAQDPCPASLTAREVHS